MVSKSLTIRGLALLAAGFSLALLTLGSGIGQARAGTPKRYGIEGQFLSYDEGKQVFHILVTSREAKGFGGSTVGERAPVAIEPGKERVFAVAPEGSVLSRTVIKSAKGTGLDTTGTQEGFRRAVKAIPTDRTLAMSIERNAEHDADARAPEYRIKTLVIQMTEEEIRRRLDELLVD